MNGKEVITGGFLVALVVGTYQEVVSPKENNPIPPMPEPTRYVGIAITYSMLGLLAQFVDEKLAGVLAGGLTLGLLMNTFQNPVKKSAPKANEPGSEPSRGKGGPLSGQNLPAPKYKEPSNPNVKPLTP